MKRNFKAITLFLALLTAVLAIFCHYDSQKTSLPVLITSATFLYHFLMRLIVGSAVSIAMKNKTDLSRPFWHVGDKERKLYESMKVKKWKAKMPTYEPGLFDPRLHSWEEIAMSSCQAEVVHAAIAILSLLPIAASHFLGSFMVFLITSLLSSLLDLSFVAVQRYNRDRIFRILKK